MVITMNSQEERKMSKSNFLCYYIVTSTILGRGEGVVGFVWLVIFDFVFVGHLSSHLSKTNSLTRFVTRFSIKCSSMESSQGVPLT